MNDITIIDRFLDTFSCYIDSGFGLLQGEVTFLTTTLIEFKLTTLAGFVLVPFALWNKTSFLAEKVLGNVVSAGIKVLVLAVIVGIGSGLLTEFQVRPDEPSIDHALVIMLASLSLLALGIFGPGIATGLVSGAPQLGAGAMAIGAAATGSGSLIAGGARLAAHARRLRRSKPVPRPLVVVQRAQWRGTEFMRFKFRDIKKYIKINVITQRKKWIY